MWVLLMSEFNFMAYHPQYVLYFFLCFFYSAQTCSKRIPSQTICPELHLSHPRNLSDHAQVALHHRGGGSAKRQPACCQLLLSPGVWRNYTSISSLPCVCVCCNDGGISAGCGRREKGLRQIRAEVLPAAEAGGAEEDVCCQSSHTDHPKLYHHSLQSAA